MMNLLPRSNDRNRDATAHRRAGWRSLLHISMALLLVCGLLVLPACGGGSGYYEAGIGYDVVYYDDPYYYDEPYWDDPCGCYYYKTATDTGDETW